jgi:hypothetical protein
MTFEFMHQSEIKAPHSTLLLAIVFEFLVAGLSQLIDCLPQSGCVSTSDIEPNFDW